MEISKIRLAAAENAWIAKVVWAALVAGVGGFIAAIWQLVNNG